MGKGYAEGPAAEERFEALERELIELRKKLESQEKES